jgi:hypothetical protein
MVELICVDPARAAEIWPVVSPLIRPALENTLTDFDTVASDVIAGRSLLWLVWDGSKLDAAVVTSISISNGRKFCTIVACGGRGLSNWKVLIGKLEQFAKAEGCRSIVIMGRRGWAREFPAYKLTSVTLEKEFA